MVNEWGISPETVESFEARNNRTAAPIYPKSLLSKEILATSDIPFLPIVGFESNNWSQMYLEAQAFADHYVPHRSHENHKGWSSLCIHGLSSVHTEAHHKYGYKNIDEVPFCWTDVAKFCPTITHFLKKSFSRFTYV